MVFKHKIPVEIVGCGIYREPDGLAMSSRNTLLTERQRNSAPFIYEILKSVKGKFNFKNQTFSLKHGACANDIYCPRGGSCLER